MKRCIVVIPTYNEAENLPLLVPEILAQDPRVEILVVDDNSPDGTGKIAEDLSRGNSRVHLLARERKEGLGRAYRAGLQHALDLGADAIIQMDADFSHPPDCIPMMLEHLEDFDVVSGSRYLNGITVVNWPIERILLSYYGNLYVRKVSGMHIRDTTGGFRCMRRSALEMIGLHKIRADGYAFQIEMNYRFQAYGAKIKEFPYFFIDRTRGTSKLTLRIGLETLWVAWWLRISRFIGRL